MFFESTLAMFPRTTSGPTLKECGQELYLHSQPGFGCHLHRHIVRGQFRTIEVLDVIGGSEQRAASIQTSGLHGPEQPVGTSLHMQTGAGSQAFPGVPNVTFFVTCSLQPFPASTWTLSMVTSFDLPRQEEVFRTLEGAWLRVLIPVRFWRACSQKLQEILRNRLLTALQFQYHNLLFSCSCDSRFQLIP